MLAFDEATHTYTYAGKVVPGVTRVLDRTIRDLSGIPRDKLENAREIGTLVHRATELDAKNELDRASIDDSIMPYMNAWWRFLEEVKPEILSHEEPIYHPTYRYAGTLDHRMVIRNDLAIVDKKTGVEDMSDAVQLSAYAHGKFHDHIAERQKHALYVLSLRPDGKYKLRKYEDHFHVFLAALTCYRFVNGG